MGGVRLISSASSIWANTGPRTKRSARMPSVLVEDLGAGDVGRHQVGRELDALEAQVEDLGQRAHQQRLGETGHAGQQAVPAGEQGHQHLVDRPLLADDHLAQFAQDASVLPATRAATSSADSGFCCAMSFTRSSCLGRRSVVVVREPRAPDPEPPSQCVSV